MAISLYDHQAEAIKKLESGKILTGDVGTGKSITAIAYGYIRVCGGMPRLQGVAYRPMTNPMNWVIITTAKKRDSKEWEQDLMYFNLGWAIDPNGVQVFVDSWNNIGEYEDWDNCFFIFDEQRAIGAGAWSKTFIKIASRNHWIILSATPGDDWKDYIPAFVANGYYRNRTDFYDRHVEMDRYSPFPKIKKYHNTERLEKIRAKILVDMPYERHTIRKTETIQVTYDQDLFKKVFDDRWNIYEDQPIKDIGELYRVMRKLVNSDLDRLGAIMKLTEKHPRLIVYYNFNYELDILRTLGATLGITVKEWNGKKHEPVPDDERWLYLVQYTAGAEGWNCITTDAIAFYSLTYSYKAFHQAKGRIDRINTPYTQLHYYVLRSASKVDQAIWKSLMTKKDFNAKAWAKKVWGLALAA